MPSANAQFILRSGNTGTSDRDLALQAFGGAVLMSFRQSTLFYDLRNTFVDIKQLSGASSHQYPLLGTAPDTEEHTAGDELLGQTQPFGETIVTIDDSRVQHRFVAGPDQLISHFDAVAPYAKDMGHKLAVSMDACIVRMAVKAARTAAVSGFHSGGNVVSRTGGGTTIADAYPESATGAANLRSDTLTLAKQMDTDEVPESGRALVLSAHGRSVLQYDTTGMLWSSDYQSANRISDRHIGRFAGFDIFVSNNSLPSTNVVNSGTSSNTTKYDVDARYVAGNIAAGTGQPIAVALCGGTVANAAVAMVVAEEFYTWMGYKPERNGTMMIARNFFGVDKLNVWCAGEIRGQLS